MLVVSHASRPVSGPGLRVERTTRRLVLTFLALTPLSAAAHAQSVVRELVPYNTPSSLAGEFGTEVEGGRDLDGDGVLDVVISSPAEAFAGGVGVVRIVSWRRMPAGGSLLAAGGPGENFGASVDLSDDMNGDGLPELVVGSPSTLPFVTGRVVVSSGDTGSILWEVSAGGAGSGFGSSVAAVGDTDGDGTPDFLVGAPRAVNPGGVDGGSAFLYSGASGALLRRANGALAGAGFGAAVSAAGDFDGDGFADYMVAAPGRSTVRVFSGADGSVLAFLDSPDADSGLGTSLCVLGDVNGDGLDELAISQPGYDGPGGAAELGRVIVVEGGTGALLYEMFVFLDGRPGIEALSGEADADGDGIPDLLVSTPKRRVIVFSGADGSQWLRYFAVAEDNSYTTLTSDFMGDINDDGAADWVVSQPWSSVAYPWAGAVTLWLNGGVEPEPYCEAALNASGEPAQISHIGSTSIGINFFYLVVDGLPQTAGRFFYGPNQIQVPWQGGIRCVGGPVARMGVAFALTSPLIDQLDFRSAPLGSGPHAVSPGQTLNFQFHFRDPQPDGSFISNFSNALAVTIAP